jgi:glycosyltransferase involved in cell wall biosynthesis
MNVPLGLALTELIAETCIPTIAHHHDFAWERPRYAVNAADDYLRAAFPPTLKSIYHVVINSYGQQQLALRTGASSTVIPNVMDFESPPPEPDGYEADLREVLGINPDEFYLLQPTRIVPRKRIERAIGLAKRLELPCMPPEMKEQTMQTSSGNISSCWMSRSFLPRISSRTNGG